MPIPRFAQDMRRLAGGPIASGAIQSVGIRLAALAIGFGQAVLTARLLGPDGYGVIALAMSTVMIAGTVSALGLGALAVREVPRRRAQADWAALHGYLRFSLRAVCVTSVAVAALVAGVAVFTGWIDPAFRPAMGLAALMIPLFTFLTWSRGVAQGLGRVVEAQAPGELLRPVVMASVLAVLFGTGIGLGPAGYVAIAIGTALLAVAITAWLTAALVRRYVPPADPLSAPTDWARAAAPFLVISVIALLLGEVNTLLLAWLATPTETGLYQPLARLAPLTLIGIQAVAMRFSPRVSELWTRHDTKALIAVTDKVTVSSTLFAVAVSAVLLGLAPWLLALFGREFTVSLPGLWWMVLAQIFNTACGPTGMLMSMSGNAQRMLATQSSGLVVNIAVGIWLIPDHGAYGAAIAFAAGITTWNVLLNIGVRRDMGFDPSLIGVARRAIRANADG